MGSPSPDCAGAVALADPAIPDADGTVAVVKLLNGGPVRCLRLLVTPEKDEVSLRAIRVEAAAEEKRGSGGGAPDMPKTPKKSTSSATPGA